MFQRYVLAPPPGRQQVAHTWCLVSGGSDGQVLLWRALDGGQLQQNEQVSGAAELARLVPHLQLAMVSCVLIALLPLRHYNGVGLCMHVR